MSSADKQVVVYHDLPPEPEVPQEEQGKSRSFLIFCSVLTLVVVAGGIAGVTYAAVPSLKPSSSEAAAANSNTADPTASPVARLTAAPTATATKEEPSSGSEDCNRGQKLVEFFIQLDQDSNHETGWSLQCSQQEEVWNVPVGILEETMENRNENNNQMSQSACVDETETCEFIIHDSYGDGLVEGNGYFYLRYGAATVATYDMAHDGEFSELVYCFGANCVHDPIEVTDECARIYLGIGLDANPQELSYQVECNDEVVLQGPWGEDKDTPFAILEEETCMPMNSCCKFTVTDSGGDGLTATGQGGDYGWIYLEYGMDMVYGYTGDDDGSFSQAEATFGSCEGV
mmetsp:Transcript_18022/g.44534  ORF Transcript_18022/g.44534 Transcript_18022/m.44534 type:complete len:344 (+) Transcript_18022:111-1142(+)